MIDTINRTRLAIYVNAGLDENYLAEFISVLNQCIAEPSEYHKVEIGLWKLVDAWMNGYSQWRSTDRYNEELSLKLYERLYILDPTRMIQMAHQHPEALIDVNQDWARWTRIMI